MSSTSFTVSFCLKSPQKAHQPVMLGNPNSSIRWAAIFSKDTSEEIKNHITNHLLNRMEIISRLTNYFKFSKAPFIWSGDQSDATVQNFMSTYNTFMKRILESPRDPELPSMGDKINLRKFVLIKNTQTGGE